MLATILLISSVGLAQHHSMLDDNTPGRYYIPRDTGIHTIADFFQLSKLHGHVRNHFMATINQGALKDYWTNGTGAALKFETAKFYGLQLGVKGIFTFQTFSSDLNETDSLVNRSAKWEKELYDVNRPNEKYDLDRLEELYLKFNFGRSFLSVGRFGVHTHPLFLARDSRMKPFAYEGVWTEINELKNNQFTLGWITGVSPRGMIEWFPINEAIGTLSNGLQPNGTPAHYHEKAHTKGIGVLGINSKVVKNLSMQYWGFWFHKLTYMNWLQFDYERQHWFTGVQYVLQTAAKKQAELDYADRYMQPDEVGNVLSAQLGTHTNNQSLVVSVAYLHSFKSGRFLFPRELGREDFYVSQPRSWIDGFGNTNVYQLCLTYQPARQGWHNLSIETRLSYWDDPGVNHAEGNKYNFINFYQVTVDARYRFERWLKGLELRLVYLCKYTPDVENVALTNIFYRTNLHHFSLIADINF